MNNELYHYGVLGMKWGVRRYQNKDGTLTRLGKKHKTAAIKGLYDVRTESLRKADVMKTYADANKEALSKSIKDDKKNGEVSWRTQALSDAYKAAGRQYVNAKYHAAIADAYISAFDNDTIKVGSDYVIKNLKRGSVSLTETGNAKENDIIKQITPEFDKKYAKELREYA